MKINNYRQNIGLCQKGMTLVEIMVAMVLVSVISAVIYNIALTQMKSVSASGSVMETSASATAGIQLMQRDLAFAGYGSLDLLDELHQKNIAFYIEDGGDNQPDKLYLFDGSFIDIEELSYDFYGELGHSPIVSGSGTTTLTLERLDLDNAVSEYDNEYAGDVNEFKEGVTQYVITNTDDPAKKVAVITGISGTQLTLDSAVSGTQIGPAVFYCVDWDGSDALCHPAGGPTEVLRRSSRDSGGRQPMVEGIVDMQIVYISGSGATATTYGAETTTPTLMDPFYAGSINLIRLSLVSRSGTSPDLPVPVQVANGKSWGAATDLAANGEYNQYRAYTINICPRNNIEFK